MTRLKVLGALGGALLLGACGTFQIEDMQNVEATDGTPFTRALTEQYRAIVNESADEYDWIDAGYFAQKGLKAAAGEVVEPELLEHWSIPGKYVDELTSARARLVAALDGNARTNMPEIAAEAQGAFDCWVEEAEEDNNPDEVYGGEDHIAACRDRFYAAMEQLEAKPAMMAPETFIVYFGFDRSDLTAEGASIIDSAVAAAQKMGISEFSVTGHADRAGSEEYNVGLSLRRANTVRDALIARGVSASNISVAGRGESEPAVATADGVPEQANRRVEINLQ